MLSERPLTYYSIDEVDIKRLSLLSGASAEELKKVANQQILCTQKELPESVEEDIKDGFFELRQKFREQGASQIYISHLILHEHHPIFSKLEVDTLKRLLVDGQIIYLNENQPLYHQGYNDQFVYFILFGFLKLTRELDSLHATGDPNQINAVDVGFVNLGWTLGEEVLFDGDLQVRQETCHATADCCLLGVKKEKM